jgi:predicted short-subunit dehydrogenase-like oxidoreductase (DUF2520 family)
MKITIVGAGRAGTSFARALRIVGHDVDLRGRGDLRVAPCDLTLLCVPDDAIALVAAELVVPEGAVVAHCAGSRTLAELAGHERVGSMHPLVALPDPETGAARLIGATYCVAGDPLVRAVVVSLRGRAIELPDELRPLYHATACVAANHLVVLLAQVERLATAAGLTLDDFTGLAQSALDDATRLGPARALTGPASRGDLATIDGHLTALDESERTLYVELARAALALAEQRAAVSPT